MSVKTALYLDLNEDMEDVSYWEKIKDYRRKAPSTKKGRLELEANAGITNDELNEKIAKGHNYHFIGKVGEFIPIAPGHGGGLLVRQNDADKTKFTSATGANGYRWLESNMVKSLGKEDAIDQSYFEKLANDAKDHISEFMNYDEFMTIDAPADKLMEAA